MKQYGSGALSCVASDGHWVVAGAARSGKSNHKEQVTVPKKTLSNVCYRGLFVWDLHSGDCVRTIRQGSFPHLVRLHFFLRGWGGEEEEEDEENILGLYTMSMCRCLTTLYHSAGPRLSLLLGPGVRWSRGGLGLELWENCQLLWQ